jgi:hypothetical protein
MRIFDLSLKLQSKRATFSAPTRQSLTEWLKGPLCTIVLLLAIAGCVAGRIYSCYLVAPAVMSRCVALSFQYFAVIVMCTLIADDRLRREAKQMRYIQVQLHRRFIRSAEIACPFEREIFSMASQRNVSNIG